MKKLMLLPLFCVLLFSAQSPKELFETNCASCHITTKPKDRSKLVAPPIMGVMFHVKQKYPTKEEAVKFIVDYVNNPSIDKALCPSVKRFGVMPKLGIDETSLKAIAEFIYDNYPPQSFRHPQMGMQQGGTQRCQQRGL